MKAIMISIKPKWCAKIMNGEKTIEVRKNKALATAIQKLINKNGYAEIYVYCSKDRKHKLEYCDTNDGCWCANDGGDYYNGKVAFKFRCYKGEEISWQIGVYELEQQRFSDFLDECCLGFCELKNYLNKKNGYAIHISNLEIFDKPKELSEFKIPCDFKCPKLGCCYCHKNTKLTKAPQNFCYVEVSL